MWKAAVSRGTDAVHAGWKAAVWRRSEDCGRTAWDRRAADRGALRARFRKASIFCVVCLDYLNLSEKGDEVQNCKDELCSLQKN
jgi:hypothetical protein